MQDTRTDRSGSERCCRRQRTGQNREEAQLTESTANGESYLAYATRVGSGSDPVYMGILSPPDAVFIPVLENKIDRESFELLIREKVYLRYARSFLPSDQIDEVDEARYLTGS
ncbi:MAG: hypothetical protein U5K56_06665 [Halioglobus sp.]|nr:hypothetical protein [Halioglobus sp.]